MVRPSRRRRRSLRFPGSERFRGVALLLACVLGLLLPAFHFEPEAAGAGSDHEADHHECSGLYEHVPDGNRLTSSCTEGERCDDPWHHHHPESRHDVSHCPVCSSLLERVVEVAIVFESAPARVTRVAPPSPRLPPNAERFAIALARGPPSLPSAPMAGAHGA